MFFQRANTPTQCSSGRARAIRRQIRQEVNSDHYIFQSFNL
nr:hypothetical protein [Bacillus inaquosorum]